MAPPSECSPHTASESGGSPESQSAKCQSFCAPLHTPSPVRQVSGSRSMLFLAASSPSESMSSSKKYPMMPLICPLWYIGQRVMVPLWEALWERTQQGTLARIFPVQRISSSLRIQTEVVIPVPADMIVQNCQHVSFRIHQRFPACCTFCCACKKRAQSQRPLLRSIAQLVSLQRPLFRMPYGFSFFSASLVTVQTRAETEEPGAGIRR